MSGTTSSPLTDAERVSTRRFCGYPMFGAGPGDATFNRYTVQYELLEYRMGAVTDAEAAVIRTYLGTLATLETGIIGAAGNLDTASAAVWTRNPAEVRDRTALFDGWRRRLCGFLGVPPGPSLNGGAGIRLVV